MTPVRASSFGPSDGAKRSKYGAVRTVVDGVSFASKREARRYSELKLLERAGEIDELKLQPRYPLIVNGQKVCTFVADFAYRQGPLYQPVVEDCKGVQTDVFRIKRKLMAACLGIEVVLS